MEVDRNGFDRKFMKYLLGLISLIDIGYGDIAGVIDHWVNSSLYPIISLCTISTVIPNKLFNNCFDKLILIIQNKTIFVDELC